MSEAEILENYWASQQAGIGTLTLFVTAFSAYLLVSYLVGAKLTKSQALFVSCAFTIFGLLCVWGTTVYFGEGFNSTLPLKDSHPNIFIIKADPSYIFVPLGLASIVGALNFMWDIRRKKPR